MVAAAGGAEVDVLCRIGMPKLRCQYAIQRAVSRSSAIAHSLCAANPICSTFRLMLL
jgi:hypothetical protein